MVSKREAMVSSVSPARTVYIGPYRSILSPWRICGIHDTYCESECPCAPVGAWSGVTEVFFDAIRHLEYPRMRIRRDPRMRAHFTSTPVQLRACLARL